MAKIVIELKNEPQKSDIICYNGSEWECVSRNQFLNQVELNKREIEKRYNELKSELADLKEKVNQKLKDYHDVIQLLTKE